MTPPARTVDTSALRLTGGPVDLRSTSTDATPGVDGMSKTEGEKALAQQGEVLADLQERLWAARTTGSRRRLLLVLQGMDTSGKGGTIRKAIGRVDPQGVQLTAFKAPTAEELGHDFLWRVRRVLPTPGHIGVFDRSHYEDVLAARVRNLVGPEEVERRYEAIRDFERELADDEVTIVKCFLHISPDEQRARLMERLDNPEKHWKYSPGDVDDRMLWNDYRHAYEVALERTGAEHAPWYVVPADRKWFRNLAVVQILVESLRALELGWPAPEFDVARERARLEAVVIE